MFFKESIVGRLHSAIGYVTPIRKEQLAAAAQAVTRVHPTGGRSVIPDGLLDQLLAGCDPQAALGRDGLVDELKRALMERALNAEMDHHLGGEAAEGRANSRKDCGRKTVLTGTGKLPIPVPRDRPACRRT